MPGSSSPAPGIPCFVGEEPVSEYLLARGIRYVAFVAPEESTFLYRIDVWEDHLYDADELWRQFAPYMVDVMENLVRLSGTRKHVAEGDGMILLDLQERR